MTLSVSRTINEDDIWDFPPQDEASVMADNLERAIEKCAVPKPCAPMPDLYLII